MVKISPVTVKVLYSYLVVFVYLRGGSAREVKERVGENEAGASQER